VLVGGLEVIEDVLEVDHREICAPGGHGLLAEDLQRAKPELQHPHRFLLHPRDLFDDLGVQAALGLEHEVFGDEEAVLLLVIAADVDFRYRRHQATSSGFSSSASPHSESPVFSSRSATSGPPDNTNRPSTSTCTKSGLMNSRMRV